MKLIADVAANFRTTFHSLSISPHNPSRGGDSVGPRSYCINYEENQYVHTVLSKGAPDYEGRSHRVKQDAVGLPLGRTLAPSESKRLSADLLVSP